MTRTDVAQNRSFVAVTAGLMLALGLACGGIGVAVDQPLSGSFRIDATDLVEDAAVGGVPPTVYAWGDDGTHILVKRRPRRGPPEPLEWWILVVEGGVTEGPFTDAELPAARERLGVSPDLTIDECLDANAPEGDVDVHRALRARLARLAEKEPWLRDRAADPARSEAERQRWGGDLERLERNALATERTLRRLGGEVEDR